MSKKAINGLRLLIQILIGCVMLLPFLITLCIWGMEPVSWFIEEITTEFNENDAYAAVTQWLLIIYIFALPGYGAFTIYAAIRNFRKQDTD